ncbi:MAG TPA: histidine phosphatase family protein [Mycobacteriales bacterium]|nr:histidine phosphatase family protein [Mycobacteriales bacterium]
MPVVLLVRHGQASFGAADYDVLSEAGREQSAAVGRELARRQLRDPLLLCGTLRRQRDTALLLGLGGEPEVDARWDEYDHLGLIERYPSGRQADVSSSQGMQVLLDDALATWVADRDGTFPAFQGGAAGALGELAGRGRDAVVVTSGGVVAALADSLLGLGGAGVVGLNRVAANCSVTKVVVGRSGASLVSYNEHAHFEGPDRRLLTYR